MRTLNLLGVTIFAGLLSNCKNDTDVVSGPEPSQIESIERVIVDKKTTDTLKTVFDFEFDDQGRVIKMVGRDHTDIKTVYELTYNSDGNLAQIDLSEQDTEVLGTQRSAYLYDNDRLVEEQMLFVDGAETELYATRTYEYNDCCENQLASVTTYFEGIETPYSIVEFTYGKDQINPTTIKYFHVASETFTEYGFEYFDSEPNALLPYYLCTQIQGNFLHLITRSVSAYSFRLTNGGLLHYQYSLDYSDEFLDANGKGKVERLAQVSEASEIYYQITYKFLHK
ncbi:MAG: hypothetical protein AB7O48_08690 [Cyclobacteriaceae bacterium]